MNAPLPTDAIQDVLNDDLSRARTLPASAYTSHDVLEWEQHVAFDGGWTCVGRSDDYLAPGDQIAISVGQTSVLMMRDQDGALNAFYNVCRHRGHELLPCGEKTNRRSLRCPYHSWLYNLDGSLKAASRFRDTENFDAAQWPLIPVRCTEWNGWVFLNMSGAGPAFPNWVGNCSRSSQGDHC